MIVVHVEDRAKEEIADIVTWYENQELGLGAEFLRELAVVFSRIEMFPESCPIAYRDVRTALTKRFPFRVYYRYETGIAMVIGVLHTSRDSEEHPH